MTVVILTKATFVETLHTQFHVHTISGATVELVLIELSEGRAISGHEAFSLTFRGPLDAFLDQGMVSLSHDVIGEFDLFIVPIVQTSDGFLYEAVFNR